MDRKGNINITFKWQEVYDALHTPAYVFLGDANNPEAYKDEASWGEGPPLTPKEVMEDFGISRRQVNAVIRGTSYKKEIDRWADDLSTIADTEEILEAREKSKEGTIYKLCPLTPTNARYLYSYNQEGALIGRRDITSQTILKGCGKSLPLSDFHRNANRDDGHSFYCKACRRKFYPKPDPRSPRAMKKALAEEGKKKCTHCYKVKEYAEFPINRSRNDGYDNNCRPCKKEKRKGKS